MPNVKLPKNLPPEQLYPFCELIATPEDGKQFIEFSGIKTYNIGFLREGFSFGITSVNIEVSPSMQPVIEIKFKDFYGNFVVEFERNKDFINSVATDGNTFEDFNYASMFDLPYPKFKLVFKGYLGKPSALELNVKRIDVAFVPSDGSYEITAQFVPNLYGFFADLPFGFLKAVKALRAKNSKLSSGYKSLFDILEVGSLLEQKKRIANESVSGKRTFINGLLTSNRSVIEELKKYIDGRTPFDGKSISGEIAGFNPLYFNVTAKRPSDLAKALTNERVQNSIMVAVASISEKPSGQKIDLNTIIQSNDSRYKNGVRLLNERTKLIDEYEKKQFVQGNESVISDVTIKSVFDLLVFDSSFLMGCILEAGRQGLKNHPERKQDKDLIGRYYPLVEDSISHEQVPDPNATEELGFVNQFINSLIEGIAEEERRGLDKPDLSVPQTDPDSKIKKRITNLEILNDINPYTISNAQGFINNLMERVGIATHFFSQDLDSLSDNKLLKQLLDSELENIKPGISKLGDDIEQLKEFCKFFIDRIDDNSELNFVNEDQDKKIIRSYISDYSLIDKESFYSNYIQHNGLYYFAPTKNFNYRFTADIITDDTYLLYKKSDFDSIQTTDPDGGVVESIMSRFTGGNKDSTASYDDSGFFSSKNSFQFIEVKSSNVSDINDLIDGKQVILYEKFKTVSQSNFETHVWDEIIQTDQLNDTTDCQGVYFYASYLNNNRNSGLIWNLLGASDESYAQRFLLKRICQSLNTIIRQEKIEQQKKVEELQAKVSSQSKIFYIQFHHLCNTWKNLIDPNKDANLIDEITNRFTSPDGIGANIIYEIPLQQIQTNKSGDININPKNSIINIAPLRDNNSQTSVLNIMSNICLKNNFMFLAIPGLGYGEGSILSEDIKDIFTPYNLLVEPDKIQPGNLFYVLWNPTPENRVKYNNGDPLYMPFNPNLQKDVFEIDFGSPDNVVIKSVNMSTEDNKITSESAIAINNIADSANSNKYKSFDCSAISVMEGRSYKISVEMIGNAQIKPTQFFVLNSTRIFTGLYQIMKVTHNLTPNNMTTKFDAIKMKYSGKQDSFVYVPPLTLESLGIKDSSQTQQQVQITNHSQDDFDGQIQDRGPSSISPADVIGSNVTSSDVILLSNIQPVKNSIRLTQSSRGNSIVAISDNNEQYTREVLITNMNQFIEDVLDPFALYLKQNDPDLYSRWYISSAIRGYVPTGSSLKSQHLKGQAVDSMITGMSSVQETMKANLKLLNLILKWYKQNPGIHYDQILFETRGPASSWIHWSYVRNAGKMQLLRLINDSTYTPAKMNGFGRTTALTDDEAVLKISI